MSIPAIILKSNKTVRVDLRDASAMDYVYFVIVEMLEKWMDSTFEVNGYYATLVETDIPMSTDKQLEFRLIKGTAFSEKMDEAKLNFLASQIQVTANATEFQRRKQLIIGGAYAILTQKPEFDLLPTDFVIFEPNTNTPS